jgi:hypothetical protein
MFGRTGVIGGGAALDGRLAINDAIVQAAGSSLPIEVALLNQLTSESEPMRKSLMAHELMIHAHSQQIAACNAAHGLEERLWRWLLQTRDLLASDTLSLDAGVPGAIRGVQRSSVTMVARKLQGFGLIRYRRGLIGILDPESPQGSSCECYQAINTYFERLVGLASRSAMTFGAHTRQIWLLRLHPHALRSSAFASRICTWPRRTLMTPST